MQKFSINNILWEIYLQVLIDSIQISNAVTMNMYQCQSKA